MFPLDYWESSLAPHSLILLKQWALDRGALFYVRSFQTFLGEEDDPPFVVSAPYPIADSLNYHDLKVSKLRFSCVLSPLSTGVGDAVCDFSLAPFLWCENALQPTLCIPSLLFLTGKQGIDGRSIFLASEAKLRACMGRLKLPVPPGSFLMPCGPGKVCLAFNAKGDPQILTILLSALLWATTEHRSLLQVALYAGGYSETLPEMTVALASSAKALLANATVADSANALFHFHADHLEMRFHGAMHSLSLFLSLLNAAIADGLTLLLHRTALQLPLHPPTPLFDAFLSPASARCLEGVISSRFLPLCHDIIVRRFATRFQDRLLDMLRRFHQTIWPQMEQNKRKMPRGLMQESFQIANDLQHLLHQLSDLGWEAKAKVLLELGAPKASALQSKITEFEHQAWSL